MYLYFNRHCLFYFCPMQRKFARWVGCLSPLSLGFFYLSEVWCLYYSGIEQNQISLHGLLVCYLFSALSQQQWLLFTSWLQSKVLNCCHDNGELKQPSLTHPAQKNCSCLSLRLGGKNSFKKELSPQRREERKRNTRPF